MMNRSHFHSYACGGFNVGDVVEVLDSEFSTVSWTARITNVNGIGQPYVIPLGKGGSPKYLFNETLLVTRRGAYPIPSV